MFKPHLMMQAAVLALVAAGCGGNRAQAGLAPEEQATVKVENEDIRDMRIYVINGSGPRWRLGTAAGSSSTTLKIPRSMVNGITELLFEIQPQSGGRRSFSQRITVNGGDEIVLRIPAGP